MKALVVDGYNVACKIPSVRAMMDKDLKAARQAITFMATEYKRKCGGFDKVLVVFDGQDRYRDQLFITPRHQRFSGTGEGDAEVIRTVSSLNARYTVVAVSDDNFIRNNARAHNASVVSVKDFVNVLNKGKSGPYQASPRGRSKGAQGAKPTVDELSPQEKKEINDELKRYWDIS